MTAPMRPTTAPATGMAQLACATSRPLTSTAWERGRRVEKRRPILTSVTRAPTHAFETAIVPHSLRSSCYRLHARNVASRSPMTRFASLSELRAACLDLGAGHPLAARTAKDRNAQLTKPLLSLGALEDAVVWLAYWQGRNPPRLDRVDVLVFAGNHGVAAQAVSAFPAAVTAQMVANFAAGGAAINQLARTAGADLRVVPLWLEQPTADFTTAAAMDEEAFLSAVVAGYDAVAPDADLVCLGEMGIGNTTAAAAIAAALFGGGGARWAGRGTGIDDHALARKRAVIDAALIRHAAALQDPLQVAAALGGRELAAILGATLSARTHNIPVLLDGFVCAAAAAPL